MNVDPHLNLPKPSSWEIIHRPIAELTPDLANPRRHSKKQIRQIADSIDSFGFNVPVLVDADLKVIAGHGRLLAARQLGFAEVPTISLEHLTPEQARAFAIADNRLTEIATWDENLLGQQLRELSELMI
jgi:ParB-like chromosome segregation protein Spo0J